MFPGLVPTLGRIFDIFTEAPRTGTKTYIHAIGSVGRMVSGSLEANGTPQRTGIFIEGLGSTLDSATN